MALTDTLKYIKIDQLSGDEKRALEDMLREKEEALQRALDAVEESLRALSKPPR